MALQAYSLARDGEAYLSPHFRVQEFRCKDGSDPVFVDTALVELLEQLRAHFGKAVTITSGYRTAAHNRAMGVEEVAACAERLLHGCGGVGRYPAKAGRAAGWVHVDTRAEKARWRG